MRESSSRTTALIVFMTLGAACFVPSTEDVASSSEAITGGSPDPSDVAVVALVQTANGTLCSGVLIGPAVVLTAAHCIYGFSAADLEVKTGDDVSSPAQTVAVSRVIPYPTYASESEGIPGGVDLGVVVLSQALGAVPVTMSTATSDASLASAKVDVVGYGLTSSAGSGTAGVRHAALLAVDTVCSRVLTAGNGAVNACQGDSGGAVFMDGKLVAVVSGGSEDCEAPTTLTRTDAHARWISEVLTSDASIACASCVTPDVSCGAATETEPASSSLDASTNADAKTPERDAGATRDAAAPGSISGGGCAIRSSGPAADGAGAWAFCIAAAASWRRRRRAR